MMRFEVDRLDSALLHDQVAGETRRAIAAGEGRFARSEGYRRDELLKLIESMR